MLIYGRWEKLMEGLSKPEDELLEAEVFLGKEIEDK